MRTILSMTMGDEDDEEVKRVKRKEVRWESLYVYMYVCIYAYSTKTLSTLSIKHKVGFWWDFFSFEVSE